MSLNDSVANMLTMIRNAIQAKKDAVEIPSSKMIVAIAKILKEEGYIENYRSMEDKKQGKVRVYLKFDARRKSAIAGIKKISRPGLRVYVGKDEIPRVLNGLGIAILSTNKGIFVDRRARKESVGGEVLCYVW